MSELDDDTSVAGLAGRRIVSAEIEGDVFTLTLDNGSQVEMRNVERLMLLLPGNEDASG